MSRAVYIYTNAINGPVRHTGRGRKYDSGGVGVYDLPHGIVRACAGVVEALDVLPDRYKQAVARAEESVGQSFDKDAVAVRKALVAAVKLSIINQKDWPYDFLEAHYGFAVSRRTFTREKRKFCWALAKELGMI